MKVTESVGPYPRVKRGTPADSRRVGQQLWLPLIHANRCSDFVIHLHQKLKKNPYFLQDCLRHGLWCLPHLTCCISPCPDTASISPGRLLQSQMPRCCLRTSVLAVCSLRALPLPAVNLSHFSPLRASLKDHLLLETSLCTVS